MLLRFLCFCSFSFVLCFDAFSINSKTFTEKDFFSLVSKQEWSSLSNSKREDLLKKFIFKDLVSIETKQNGFLYDPFLSRKIQNRVDQFLVNVAYDLFVALPLVDSVDFQNTKKHLSKEINVSHLLVGYSGCRLPVPITRSKEEALVYVKNIHKELLAGSEFKNSAMLFSEDPSVERNGGNLGWLSWGRTVPEFQNIAFDLNINNFSEPVLTDFGYHIIFLNDTRPSQASLLDSLSFLAMCAEKTIASVPLNKKRPAAEIYDNQLLLGNGLVFNNSSLEKIYKKIIKENKKNKIIASSKKSLISLLDSFENIGVVCVFNNEGYGVRWFSNHFKRLPSSRIPSIKSIEDLRSSFKLAVLQHLNLNKINIHYNDFSYILNSKIDNLSKNIIFDSFIKYTINNTKEINSDSLISYYNNNKAENYLEKDLVEVREIKTLNFALSDSLYNLLLNGASFVDLANLFSLTNPKNGGLIDPFTKNRYGPMGKKAFELSVSSFSAPIENLDGTWSLIFLEKTLDSLFVPFSRVESKIKSLLKKENQRLSKQNLYDSLYNKYSVWINDSLLTQKN